ncbi:MAG: hypothetical protein KBT15_10220 [Bacteroidales bacterium]|nr:hypothetical protein [Candidatus Minthousia equi]
MEKKVFLEDSFIETQTRFFENGKVVTDLCGWEVDKVIVAGGRNEVRQRGILTTTDGVGTTFVPYSTGGKPTYKQLYNTQHAVVQHSAHNVMVKFKLPKNMGKRAMQRALENEIEEICEYIQELRSVSPIRTQDWRRL